MQALVRVATTYESLDAGKGTGIIEKVIDQVNELVAAALVLNGFDVQGYFRNGEFIIMGGNLLNNIAQECGQVLAANANHDFDRARSAAERFQRPEMRLIALSQIVQGLLTSSERIDDRVERSSSFPERVLRVGNPTGPYHRAGRAANLTRPLSTPTTKSTASVARLSLICSARDVRN